MEHLTKAVIDLNCIEHNYKQFRNFIPSQTEVMGVVKADAYGHGAPFVSDILVKNGCNYLAVARISEVTELREKGILTPILLFGFSDPSYVDYMVNNCITASAGSLNSAEILGSSALLTGKNLKTHIKIDTGMGRIGSKTEIGEIVKEVLAIGRVKGLDIEGIYTHFANADSEDKNHALRQFEIYSEVLERVKKEGMEFKLRHAANSAATIDLPETHLDMVRPGISLYGLDPSSEVDRTKLSLKPAMSLQSKIIQVKDVPAGFKVSYGSTYTTTKPTKIAVVPIGYADGYSRLLSSKGQMIVNGTKVPVLGRVCMDLTMIDVGNVDSVETGDRVTIIGKDGDESLSADDIASSINTINYEVVSSLTSRVKKEYRCNN